MVLLCVPECPRPETRLPPLFPSTHWGWFQGRLTGCGCCCLPSSARLSVCVSVFCTFSHGPRPPPTPREAPSLGHLFFLSRGPAACAGTGPGAGSPSQRAGPPGPHGPSAPFPPHFHPARQTRGRWSACPGRWALSRRVREVPGTERPAVLSPPLGRTGRGRGDGPRDSLSLVCTRTRMHASAWVVAGPAGRSLAPDHAMSSARGNRGVNTLPAGETDPARVRTANTE